MTENEKNFLFKSFETNKINLRNRFVMAPVPTGFIKDGVPTGTNIQFYGKRAESIGLIIAGAININHPTASNNDKIPFINSEAAIAAWKEITDEVHAKNGKIVGQIWHSGGFRKLGQPDLSSEATTPSGLFNGEKIGEPMTKEEIKDMISTFAEAAGNVKKAGFDGVEIHGAHGSLIHDFFCDNMNKRTDEYGPSHRTLFAEEVIKACREVVGDEFPILLRISHFKMYDLGAQLAASPQEFESFIVPLSKAGVDIFDCSALNFTDSAFEGVEGSLAYWTKQFTNKPTINIGNVGSQKPFLHDLPELITKIVTNQDLSDKASSGKQTKINNIDALNRSLENDEYDLVAVGRPLLIDAEWLNKL